MEKGSTVKTVKTSGLLAAVAVFAMALLGPSIAMGESTSLCSADEDPCNSPVSHVHYVSNDLKVETSVMDYECDSLLLADVSELGSPQVLEGSFTYTNCGSCTREEENGPAILNFLKTGHETAAGTGESLVFVDCGSFIECSYTLENVTGSVIGPLLSSENNGEIKFKKAPLTHEEGGLFCPAEAYLKATFVPLSPTYISS